MKTTRLCPHCGTEFTRIHTADKPPKFCSQSCRNKGRDVPPEVRAKQAHHGPDHPNFKGGHYTWGSKSQNKYRMDWLAPADRIWPTVNAKGFIHRSHLVWNLAHPDTPVQRGQVVHHINGDSLDDRAENVQPMTQAEHMRIHWDERSADRRRDEGGRFTK